jgi:hypothetical protein
MQGSAAKAIRWNGLAVAVVIAVSLASTATAQATRCRGKVVTDLLT